MDGFNGYVGIGSLAMRYRGKQPCYLRWIFSRRKVYNGFRLVV